MSSQELARTPSNNAQSTWNLNSQGFENQGLSHVFVVFQPRLTVGEVIDQGKRVKKSPVPKCWMAAALRFEQKMLNTATERKRTGGPCLSSPRLAKLFPGRDIVYLPGFSPHAPWTTLQDCNEMFTGINDMQRIKQTSSKEHWEPYTLPIATAARSLRAFCEFWPNDRQHLKLTLASVTNSFG